MKTIYKKKALCILLALALVFTLTPAIPGAVENAYAAEPGISITDSTADSSGTGWSYVESTKTLTLSSYSGGYIQGSGLSTLNLVLEGTSTITVDDANAKGIALGNNQNLNISGSGSLTINAMGGSNFIYGIECNKFTMTSGTVTINANSSRIVYGVYANSSLSVTGGKLTANITGTSDALNTDAIMNLILAVNPDIDIADLERISGPDVMELVRIGRNFTTARSAAQSEESGSESSSETTPEPSTSQSESSDGNA